jgi:hypothetical protein
MIYPSQDSYDVLKDGRFVGRIKIVVPNEMYSVRFAVRQTFEEWRMAGEPFPVIEMPLHKFMFMGTLRRVFDAEGVPMSALYRVDCFQPAY